MDKEKGAWGWGKSRDRPGYCGSVEPSSMKLLLVKITLRMSSGIPEIPVKTLPFTTACVPLLRQLRTRYAYKNNIDFPH